MSLTLTDLTRRLLRRSAITPPAKAAKLRIEPLEDRAVPSAVVTVAKIADADETVTPGLFRFTRSNDDLSQPLTVTFEVGGTATEGEDYVTLPRQVTFPPGESTVDLSVTPRADNEFEETEEVLITLSGPPEGWTEYVLSGSTTATASLQDDPPQVTGTATWQASGSEIGRVTLTRSGGDISQPLTVWFEPSGTLTEDGETLTVTLAATAVIPAGLTAVTLSLIADPENGGIANVQMPGATVAPQRADRSQQLFDLLDSSGGAGDRFADAVRQLPSPLTFQEYLLLRSVSRGDIDPELFGGSAVLLNARDAARARLTDLIDWRTVPVPPGQGLGAVVGGTGAYAGVLTTIPDWPQLSQRLDSLIVGLGDDDGPTRDQAEQDLGNLILDALRRGDITRATLILRRLDLVYNDPNTELEVQRRISRILAQGRGLPGIQAYSEFRLTAVAAVVGGWVLDTSVE